MKKPFFIILLSILSSALFAQQVTDSIKQPEKDSIQLNISNASQDLKFNYKALIIPTVFIGYGVISLESDGLKSLNIEIREEVNEHIDDKFTIDDISQYAPFASVYALNALGVKGKHNFKDRTIILGTAYILMGTSTVALKKWTGVERPDGSSNNSFPSGHTATAFMGAEFLYQEYKDISPWYGIAGYVVATGTGVFRMYNNRHWFSDVVAGAGIGILSTKIAYWIHPWMKEKIFKDKKNKIDGLAMPFYNGKQGGLGMVINF
ncbi:MAG TPA: PA-phosphatase [Chryseobacterium sp.]|nr:PA-phosphatase [Chryseobacterium sp.]